MRKPGFRLENNPVFNVLLPAVMIVFAIGHSGAGSRSILEAGQSDPSGIVISQIYGGGGNSGAAYNRDFIELFNRGKTAVDLSGWAIHYASATGRNWQRTALSGTIAPGGFVLIHQAAGGSNGSPLPEADLTGTIAMAATAGKVALTSADIPLPGDGTCPSGPAIVDLAIVDLAIVDLAIVDLAIVDLVGYGGNASCFEGAGPAPAPSSSRSVQRAGEGCHDSNDNAVDFGVATPAPRNSSSTPVRCTQDPEPEPEPVGLPFPETADSSSQKAGAILIFPIYSSRSTNPVSENTRISLTNTDPTREATAHLFFINGEDGSAADFYLCLSPAQTSSFYASDIDPGITGYLIAIAVDRLTGCPVVFNSLIGDLSLKLASGHSTALGADAFSALTAPACPAGATAVEIRFDGVHFNPGPRVLAVSNLMSPLDGNDARLVVVRIGGDLTRSLGPFGTLRGLLYDDSENAFSFEIDESGSQLRAMISGNIPRTSPRISSLIPGGRSGWIKMWPADESAITGVIITASSNSDFRHGRNLHRLEMTTSASLTIPVLTPSC